MRSRVIILISQPEKVSRIAIVGLVFALEIIVSFVDTSETIQPVVGITQTVASLAGTRSLRIPVYVSRILLAVKRTRPTPCIYKREKRKLSTHFIRYS